MCVHYQIFRGVPRSNFVGNPLEMHVSNGFARKFVTQENPSQETSSQGFPTKISTHFQRPVVRRKFQRFSNEPGFLIFQRTSYESSLRRFSNEHNCISYKLISYKLPRNETFSDTLVTNIYDRFSQAFPTKSAFF